MGIVLKKSRHDDRFLRLELFSFLEDGKCEYMSAEVSSFTVITRENEYLTADLFVNKNAAENCKRFFDEFINKNCRITARLYFSNNETYYYWGDAYFFNIFYDVTLGSDVLVKLTAPIRSCDLVKGEAATKNFEDFYTAEETVVEDASIKEIVEESICWQQNNMPRALSPIEQMRLKANNMFGSSLDTAPVARNENRSEQSTGQNQIFNPETLTITSGSKDYKKDLEKIIGLEEVKTEFEKMVVTYRFQKDRAERMGTEVKQNNMHMCFLGSPGTGKTTIARVVAGYLYENGIIKNNECIEISGLDMVANYAGQTSEKTRIILERAKGGVLFIDEAYALADDGFGQEAISVLLKAMEDDRGELVVIFAGYERDMMRFLDMNEGFKSRVNRYFHFNDYKPNELARIFMRVIHGKNLIITEEALMEVVKTFAKECEAPGFSNGRFVRNFVEKIENQHIYNIRNRTDNTDINLITVEDVKR